MPKNNLLSKELDKTQRLCNEFIRFRDMQRDSNGFLFVICISCKAKLVMDKDGRNPKAHAGHYWRENQYSSIRYDENNIHMQCARCNRELSGNLAEYEIALENKIGVNKTSELEYRRNQIKKWNFTELEQFQERFKAQIKQEKIRLKLIEG